MNPVINLPTEFVFNFCNTVFRNKSTSLQTALLIQGGAETIRRFTSKEDVPTWYKQFYYDFFS